MGNYFKKSHERFINYIYDSSISIKDRSFVLFSLTVLTALIVAIPCGLIMHEPIMATISTLAGTIFFSAYVQYSIHKKRISRAKMEISVVLIFVFLPVMFFTNGGVYGGTPIWLLLGTLYIVFILDGTQQIVMLILNAIVITITWIVGYKYPGLVTEYSRAGNFFDTLSALFIVGGIVYSLLSFQNRLFRKEEEQKNARRLFEQTATALVNAIDAKDKYTHGHSARVAEYSKKIAEFAGMSKSECEEIYYVALLHDVGKIGIPEQIINKEGRLTDEEYAIIKQHTILGAQILHSISEYPNLSIGAQSHHERYDGKGYPERLKGEDIPVYARIISVADAYDAMTSKRSYRDAIPQQTVREEIIKGSGTQFDPKYAKIIQHLIDLDSDYSMKEGTEVKELAGRDELLCGKYREARSEGILLTPEIRTIKFKAGPLDKKSPGGQPALILFDSLDARYHDTEKEIKELNYFEYAEIWLDGSNNCKGARKIQVEEYLSEKPEIKETTPGITAYEMEAVKFKDHVMIRIDNGSKLLRLIVALPDSTRYAYISLTGVKCRLFDVNIEQSEESVNEKYIPRIAEEISYIMGPAGDIPNVQIDGYRTDATEGIPVRDGMKITFHTMSLPTARLVWHCAFVDLFYASDRKPNGEDFKEYALIRLDGEGWEADGTAENVTIVNKDDDFIDWEAWKQYNKKGYDCTVYFERDGNKITTMTENMGISIKIITTVLDEAEDVYVALTGDQCAITNIRIIQKEDEQDAES